MDRKDVEIVTRKYSGEKRQWLVDLYKARPILFLDEAKYEFDREFNTQISRSYISVILREAGLTWKVLERRAIQISEADVIRFCKDMLTFPWILQSLVFLDEVSFDNRDMLRKIYMDINETSFVCVPQRDQQRCIHGSKRVSSLPSDII